MNNIKNLVFEGGGVLGVAYQGAYEVLIEQQLLDNIEKVAGTSTGAIATLLISLKYSKEESRKLLLELDFQTLPDGGWTGFFRIFRSFGWYKGDAFFDFFKKIIAHKLGNPLATFADFKKFGCKDAYFIATNLTKQTSQVFSYQHSPNLPVAEAVRMSISVPFFFAAQKYQSDWIVDGGVMRNYAIDIFDKNLKILGFELEKHETMGFFFDQKPKGVQIHSFLSFFKAFIKALENSQYDWLKHNPEDLNRTVLIDVLGIHSLDFKITIEQKIALMEQGKIATLNFLQKYDIIRKG
jgi:NTE family protein